jgi:hypothetical protein
MAGAGMSDTLIFADDLARTLETTKEGVYEMARTRKLPFAISTARPRRLFIEARDLPQWRAAVRALH